MDYKDDDILNIQREIPINEKHYELKFNQFKSLYELAQSHLNDKNYILACNVASRLSIKFIEDQTYIDYLNDIMASKMCLEILNNLSVENTSQEVVYLIWFLKKC